MYLKLPSPVLAPFLDEKQNCAGTIGIYYNKWETAIGGNELGKFIGVSIGVQLTVYRDPFPD